MDHLVVEQLSRIADHMWHLRTTQEQVHKDLARIAFALYLGVGIFAIQFAILIHTLATHL